MYPRGAQTWVEVTRIDPGAYAAQFRPGHFRGVTTVVAKLFNIVKPHIALFGAKDYQQLCAVRQMVRDLNFDVEIVAMPTVREPDGLAMSSRNSYLAAAERAVALSLSRALEAARAARNRGETGCAARWSKPLARNWPARAAWWSSTSSAATRTRWRKSATVSAPAVIAIAARVGRTRLIDNMVLEPGRAVRS